MSARTLFVFLWVCGLLTRSLAAQPSTPDQPLILVSMDGFRWDYMDRFPEEAATLRMLRREGVSARGLVPVFPSNTFPNHYTIVTGLLPTHHGMINNEFFDASLGEFFRYTQPAAVRDSRWWGGEPIWITAVKQGRKAAAAFWVGSEAEIQGLRPTYWRPFDARLPFEERLAELTGWFRRPLAERPALVVFYLEEANGVGHRFGPASPEIRDAVKLLDGRLATLLAQLRAEAIEPNLVIVSDHGMTETSASRVLILEDFVARDHVQIETEGSLLALRPLRGDADALVAAFAGAAHAKAYRAENLPAHFRLRTGPRVAPVWVVPDEGWHVVSRATFERIRERYPERGYLPGDHGYDPALRSMHGIFVAHGPAFGRGVELSEVENIHIYNLLCAVLKLQPAKNDGDDRLVRAALRGRVAR